MVTNHAQKNPARTLLVAVQRRIPAGQRFVQEAFTTEHRRPVLVKIGDLSSDTFYIVDDITARALCDAITDLAAQTGGNRLTVSYPFAGELKAVQHRLEHLSSKFDKIRVLANGQAPRVNGGLEFRNIAGNLLTRFRFALKEGRRPMMFICRDMPRYRATGQTRSLGFFTLNAEIIAEIADDIDLAARGLTNRVTAFDKLEVLHRTTQQVARELESYSRRMDIAISQAKRRPDLLTPARFERIVVQAIAKMEQLKEIPRQALRAIDRPGR